MAKLHGLTYKSPLEELSERFHMSENLLRTLNPGADFDRAGTTIIVADVQPMVLHHGRHTIEAVQPTREQVESRSVDTIVVDKPARRYAPIQKRGSFSGSTRPPLVVKRNRHLLGQGEARRLESGLSLRSKLDLPWSIPEQ